MLVRKNESMLEEERMDERGRYLKKYKLKESFSERDKRRLKAKQMYSPIGHIYSVICEELKIEKPDLRSFIDRLNKYIEIGRDKYTIITSNYEALGYCSAKMLRLFLEIEWSEKMTNLSLEKIMLEAYGGYYEPE